MDRIFFVHSSRIIDSIITLSFDYMLDPVPKHTYIYYGPGSQDLLAIYRQHGINTDNFTVIHDRDFIPEYLHKFTPWLVQQLAKLIALDTLDYDSILIQDCDTFAIKPYRYSEPTYFVYKELMVLDTTQYRQVIKNYQSLTNMPASYGASFISEFMPIKKSDWTAFKQHIAPDGQWLATLCKFIDSIDQLHFSEYEILGNWIADRTAIQTVEQRRLEIKNSTQRHWEQLLSTGHFNCVCLYKNFTWSDIDRVVSVIKNQIKATDY